MAITQTGASVVCVISLTQENGNPHWFMTAARSLARRAERLALVNRMVEAIGDRRSRDFLDLIAGCESQLGWEHTSDIVSEASAEFCLSPRPNTIQVLPFQPLKLREMTFGLMACDGLEPAALNLNAALESARTENSLADARRTFSRLVIESLSAQVSSGDTLFLDSHTDGLPDDLKRLIETTQASDIEASTVTEAEGSLDLSALWLAESGRRVLTDLGVKGRSIPARDRSLLDVIQVSLGSPVSVVSATEQNHHIQSSVRPTHPEYLRLHRAMIEQDLREVSVLGSSLSAPVLNIIARDMLSEYERSQNSSSYRRLLQCMDAMVAVRATDSISTIAELMETGNSRVAFPAVSALGNFYQESSAAILIEKIQSSRNHEFKEACCLALERIHERTPIAEPLILEAIETGNKGRRALRRILKKRAWALSAMDL